MKLFKNGFFKSPLFTFIKGFAVHNPVVGGVIGAIEGVANRHKKIVSENKASEVGGNGKYDIAEIAGAITGTILVLVSAYMLLTGQISYSDFVSANG